MIVTKFHENRLKIDREIRKNMRSWLITFNVTLGIVGLTLTVVNEFHRFLGQFPTNFHEILHTLFSIDVVTIPFEL